MNDNNTQLTSPHRYNVNRMIFSQPIVSNIPNSNPPISYRRILISTRNEDGSSGELVLPTGLLFSFGISENLAMNGSGEVSGHSMSLCLWSKDGATEEEVEWIETFNSIIANCKKHLLTDKTKEAIQKYELDDSELKKLNPLYYKKDKGKIVENVGPTLYAKLIESKKQGKILTKFSDVEGNDLNPLDLVGKFCHTRAAVKIESIFIGTKISMQVKLYEASDVKLLETGMKRLLQRPEANSRVSVAPTVAVANDDDDVGSLNGDDEDKPAPVPTPVPAAPTKVLRNAKRVVRSAKTEE